MDDFKKKVAPTGIWGRKERKMNKATARAQIKLETFKERAEALVGDAEVDLEAPIEGPVDLDEEE